VAGETPGEPGSGAAWSLKHSSNALSPWCAFQWSGIYHTLRRAVP